MKTKKSFLAWEFFFQIGWLAIPMFVLSIFDLNVFAHIGLSILIYLNQVFNAAEVSFLDWRISELEKNNPQKG